MTSPHPPSPWRRLRQRIGPLVRTVIPSRLPMRGPYPSYAAALAEATGYDSPCVVEQVEAATVAVLEGRAAYERDGIALASRPDLPIHAALRPLLRPDTTIADVGGGLGGLYINGRDLFPPDCRRLVIEQPSMVAAGRRLCANYALGLEFMEADEDALPRVDVLVLSGVLPYLPDPWGQLARWLEHGQPEAVIVDRTAVRRGSSRWFVQTNPGYYREAVSYPIQVLDQRRLLAAFSGYKLAKRWRNTFDAGRPTHIGLLFVRSDQPSLAAGEAP